MNFNPIRVAISLSINKIPLWFHLGCDQSGVRGLILHVVVIDGDVHMVEDVEGVFVVELRLRTETE